MLRISFFFYKYIVETVRELCDVQDHIFPLHSKLCVSRNHLISAEWHPAAGVRPGNDTPGQDSEASEASDRGRVTEHFESFPSIPSW